MAEQKQKQQVGSKKVNELRPLDNGINITVKVISKKTIAQRNRLAECLVGDDTGIIIFTARNDQVYLVKTEDLLKTTSQPHLRGTNYLHFILQDPIVWEYTGSESLEVAYKEEVDLIREDSTLVLTKAKVDMFKGSMRLAVDRFGRIEVGTPASFSVEKDINMSLIEFERVDVVV